MNTKMSIWAAGVAVAVMTAAGGVMAAGDADKGRAAFRACAACHSLAPDDHRTGPSLSDIWNRKSGSMISFRRYSKALKDSDVVWTEDTLDRWLRDPKALVPGNRMAFRGVADAATRADLIQFLKRLSEDGAKVAEGNSGRAMVQRISELKTLGPDNRVAAVTYCADTYTVTTKAGETHQFWEFNLRFKTDSSARGPAKGTPALIPAGMRGDRASLVFTAPEEIGAFIKRGC